jgi:AraC-like DNA-binding protein
MLPVHLSSDLSLFQIERASYVNLNIRKLVPKHWLVSLVIRGEVRTETGDFSSLVRPGEAMIHPPQLPFDETSQSPGTHEWFEFDVRVVPGVEGLRLNPEPCVIKLRDLETFRNAFNQALLCHQGAPTGALGAILLLHHELVSSGWTHRRYRHRFEDVVQHIKQSFHSPISRDELAGIASMHPNAFDRAFRAAHGISPMALVRRTRLSEARNRLANSDQTIESVALGVGFPNCPYFTRVFKSEFGLTPGEFRKSVKERRTSYISE